MGGAGIGNSDRRVTRCFSRALGPAEGVDSVLGRLRHRSRSPLKGLGRGREGESERPGRTVLGNGRNLLGKARLAGVFRGKSGINTALTVPSQLARLTTSPNTAPTLLLHHDLHHKYLNTP